MERTKVFKNGGSFAVRLPRKYALPVGDIMIGEREGMLVLMPLDDNGWPEDMGTWFPDPGDLEIPPRPEDSKPVEI